MTDEELLTKLSIELPAARKDTNKYWSSRHERRKELGLCTRCGKPLDKGSKHFACAACCKKVNDARYVIPGLRAKEQERNRQRQKSLKDRVFDAYGGYKCSCCGETEPTFLCIDHINGGGSKHRRELKNTIYRWLELNNFPSGYQVLCHNCNFSKRLNNGVCAHQIEVGKLWRL